MYKTMLISLILLSISVQAVALGVSPETLEICMGPGEIHSTRFYPSTNSLQSFDIDIQISSELDIRGNTSILLNPNDITEYPLFIVEPSKGLYESDIYFCKTSDITGHKVKQCIKARLLANVTEDCAAQSISYSNKTLIQLILVAAIIILSGYWLIKR